MSSSAGEEGVINLKNAARSGNKDRVVELLNNGVDPNQFGSQSDEAKSPLMVACENGHGEIAEVLITRGAEVDLRKTRGQKSALLQAVSSENVEMTRLLLKHKAKVRFEYHHESAVRTACRAGNIDLVKLLLPFDTWDDSNYVQNMFSEVISKGYTEVVKFLLESKLIDHALVKFVDLLHSACSVRDDPEMVEIILSKKPDTLNCTVATSHEDEGFTALMQACRRGHTGIVNLLLVKGAELDYQSKIPSTRGYVQTPEGLSALMVACIAGKSEIVKLLLEKGAKVDLRTTTGGTALLFSTVSGSSDLNLSWAFENRDYNSVRLEIIRLLLSKNASVDVQDKTGGTALLYAVKDRSLEAVNLLLEKNARVDIGTDRFGTPLLHLAVRYFRPDVASARLKIAKLLLERGAPVDILDYSRKTPLIVACECGNAELINILVEKGSNIDHYDKVGGYALLYAVNSYVQRYGSHGLIEAIELLLKKGAKAEIKPDKGESALSIMEKNATLLIVSTTVSINDYNNQYAHISAHRKKLSQKN